MTDQKDERIAEQETIRPHGSAIDMAWSDIARLEESLVIAANLSRIAHRSAMRASERIGELNETGAAHACLALMEISSRALSQANDAARYARHTLTYPPRQ